jgi:hypothetical protein
MGMYDVVKVLYPLPIADAQGLEFQTKDLGSDMSRYEIRRNGRLYQELRLGEGRYRWIGGIVPPGRKLRLIGDRASGTEHPPFVFYEFEVTFRRDGRVRRITGSARTEDGGPWFPKAVDPASSQAAERRAIKKFVHALRKKGLMVK